MLLAIFAGWALAAGLGFSGRVERFGLRGRTTILVGMLEGFGGGGTGSRSSALVVGSAGMPTQSFRLSPGRNRAWP